ncbi:hypothetical protein TNCV_1402681 [Trichonephila clavipes]|nr:hypothetical protein TNCV_1402681 [Trichonephila clavipes]
METLDLFSIITYFTYKKVLENKLKVKDKKKEPQASSEPKNIQRHLVKKSNRDLEMIPVLGSNESFHSDGSSVIENKDSECIFCKGKCFDDQ